MMKRIILVAFTLLAVFHSGAKEVSETIMIQPRRPRPCRCTTTVVEYCGICCMKEDGIRCCPGHPRKVPLNHDYACSGYYPAEYSTEFYTIPDSFSDDPLGDAGTMEDQSEVLEIQGTKAADLAEEKLETELENLLENTGIPGEKAREAEIVFRNLELLAQEKNRKETPETGDPVCLATGEYVSTVEEGALPVGELDHCIHRYYGSQGAPVPGLFGTLWRSSLEDRILRGYNPLSGELVALQNRANNEAELTAHGLELLRDQTLEALDKSIEELNQKLSLCGEALVSFRREREEASHEKFKTFFDGLITAFTKTSRELDNALTVLSARRRRLAESLFPEAMDLLDFLMVKEWKEALLTLQNQYALSQVNRELNGGDDPGGLPSSWGNGTVVLIDEKGSPLIFRIDEDPDYDNPATLEGTGFANHYPRGSSLTGPGGLGFTLSLTPSGQYLRRFADGSVKTYSFQGRPLRWEDRNGRGINYIYHQGGEILKQLTADDGRTIFLATRNGLIEEIRFPQGRVRSFRYEASRLISVTDGLGDTISYEYEGNRLTRVIKPDHSFRQYIYGRDEETGRMVVQEGVDEEGGKELFRYDFKNARGTYIGPGGEETHQFDERLRVVKIDYADGSREEWEYGEEGFPLWYRDQKGDIHGYRYDHRGNLTGITRNGAVLAERAFSPEGFLQEERLFSRGRPMITEYVRDRAGRIVTRIFHNYTGSGSRGEQVYRYHTGSGIGLVSVYIDAEGHQVIYDYDDRGFLVSWSETLGVYVSGGGEERRVRREEYIKRDDDKLEERKVYDGEILVLHHRYLWDGEARLLGVFDLINQRHIDKREYNNRGDLTEHRDHRGEVWKVRYDRCHRPREILNPLGESLVLTYDGFGRLQERRLLSRQGDLFEWWSFTYDRAGRMIREEENLSGMTREYSFYPGGDVARESRYSREAPQEAMVREYYYNLPYPGPAVPGGGKTIKTVDQGVWTSWEVLAADTEELLCRITPGGRVSRWEYNGFGDVTEKTGFGELLRFRFDREGRVIEEHRGGVATLLERDGRGRLRKVQDQNNRELERRGYGALDELLYRRNPLGREETMVYDSRGRLIQRTGGEGTEERWSYPSSERVDYTDQEGHTWSFLRDGLGRQIVVIDPGGFETRRDYDPAGRLSLVTDPAGGVSQYRYDPRGLLLETVDPLKTAITREYDSMGRPEVVTDQAGVRFSWDYTHQEREGRTLLITSALVEGRLMSRRYTDGDGLTVREETPSGAAYQWEYDERGRLAAEENWGGLRKEYSYQNERLTETSDFEGRIRRFSYDPRGRLFLEESDGGDRLSYGYDVMGNLTQAVSPDDTLRFSYDSSGRMVSQEKDGLTLQYRYTPGGQISRIEWSSGETAFFRYTPQGRTAEITDYSGGKTKFFYDGCGRIVEEVFPNGMGRIFSYDLAGRLQREILRRGSGPMAEILGGTVYGYDPRGLVVSEVFSDGSFNAYRYDSSGRLLQAVYPDTPERRALAIQMHNRFGQRHPSGPATNNNNGPRPLPPDQESWLSALKNEMEQLFARFPQRGLATLKRNQSLWSDTHSFDGDGNRIQTSDGFGTLEFRYEGEDPHAVTRAGDKTYQYDPQGNLIEISNSRETESFHYDSRGLMIEYEKRRDGESSFVSYRYDGLGRRSGAFRTMQTGRGPAAVTFESWTCQGRSFLPLRRALHPGVPEEPSKPLQSGTAARLRIWTTGEVSREEESVQTYLYRDQKAIFLQSRGREPSFPDSRPSTLKSPGPAGTRRDTYLLTDIRGTPTAVMGVDGSMKSPGTYTAHGAFLPAEEDSIPLGFNGKPLDRFTNLYGYGLRDYQPDLGLFITRDPAKDGMNWYSYCHHDPVNYIDPLGLDDVYAVYNDGLNSLEVTYVNTTDFGASPLVAITRMTATNNVRNEIDPDYRRVRPDVMTLPEKAREAPRYYYPRKFPEGTHNLTAEITPLASKNMMGKWNIDTDATQWVPTYDDQYGEDEASYQLDGGYRIHSGSDKVEATTLGCIRLLEPDVETLWEMVNRSNTSLGVAQLTVECNN